MRETKITDTAQILKMAAYINETLFFNRILFISRTNPSVNVMTCRNDIKTLLFAVDASGSFQRSSTSLLYSTCLTLLYNESEI